MFLNKNIKILSIVLIILILLAGCIIYFSFFNFNTAKVGSSELVLPKGYYEDGVNEFGAVRITDGRNEVFLIEFNDTDAYRHAQEYVDSKNGTGESVYLSQFDIDNRTIYKSSNFQKSSNVHYWFEKGNKSYEVYKWDGNPKMDDIAMFFFNS